MRAFVPFVIAAAFAAALSAPAVAQSAPKPQEVRLAGSAKWRGGVGDRVDFVLREGAVTKQLTGTVTAIDPQRGVITIEVDAGKPRPFLATQIVSMKTVGGAAAAPAPSGGAKQPSAPVPASGAPSAKPSGKKDAQGYDLDERGYRISPKRGVFLLPWKGGVGQTARHNEIEAVAAEADKWGPGQTIILDIDSPGGLVIEIFKIVKTIEKVKERHRVVVWVKEAISAAAVTSMQCEEIYFRSEGALGAAMMIQGADSAYGEQLDKFRDEIGEKVEMNGRHRMIFEAMVLAGAVLTYTKDPVTGKVEWHDKVTGLPGEVILSDEKDNLTFNASNALDSGFSKGTADTKEELAKLLDLPEWYEVSDFGVKMATTFVKNFEECEKDIDLQMGRRGIQRASPREQLSTEIEVIERVLKWAKKCPPCVASKFGQLDVAPVVEDLQKRLKDLKKQLSDLNKAGNG
jgi:ATP-dependent protease ClpP protease subunit